MTGRLIRLDPFKRRVNGGRSGAEDGDGRISSGYNTEELLAAADRDYFDDAGRRKNDDRLRAMMRVLLSEPDLMRENLREAAEMGGLLRFPPLQPFPLKTAGAAYANEEELREFVPEQMADQLIAKRREEIAAALSAHSAEATRLMRDLTAIAGARMAGTEPGEILTTEHLRMALTTEMVSQTTLHHIRDTRHKVRTVINTLMQKSENGVKAAPLAVTMKNIGHLCTTMTRDLDKLSAMAARATERNGRGREKEKEAQVTAITRRAREVFAPFVQGAHVITMEQLRDLESFLHETGEHNHNIGALLQDGLRAIRQATEAGKHEEARNIEEFIGFDRQVEDFERMTRTMDHQFATRASILSFAGAGNRSILASTPPAMLREAEIQSGLLSEMLLERRDGELVMGSEDGLELG